MGDWVLTSKQPAQVKSDWVLTDSIEPQQPQSNSLPAPVSMALNAALAIPDMMKGLTNPREVIGNRIAATGQGVREIGQGVKQLGIDTGEFIGLLPEGSGQDYQAQTDIQRDIYSRTPAGQDRYASFLKSGVEQSPYIALSPVLSAEGALLSKIAKSALATGAIEGTKYVPAGGSRASNVIKGLELGAVLPLVEPAANVGLGLLERTSNVGLRDIGSALHPRNIFPSNAMARFSTSPLSTEEILRNQEAAQGTATGLGNIIGSPTMKRAQENAITKIIFSGGNQSLQETGNQIINRGNSIVERFRNDIPHEDVTNQLGEALTSVKNAHTQLKNDLYTRSNEVADKVGLKLRLPRFSEMASRHIDALESSNMLQFEPEARSLINRLRNYQNPTRQTQRVGAIVDKAGNPLINETVETLPRLQEANILAGKLNEMANKYGASLTISDRNAARVFGQLATALKTDIRTSVFNSGSKDLINSFRQAERNYANNYSTFLDKDIHKYTVKGEPPENILTTFLKTSNTADKADQLEKLMSKLNPSQQDMVRYSYFSRALEGAEDMRVINPNKLSTLWNKLGTRQKRVFMPSAAQRREMDNFSRLVGMNQKAVNMMWNPQTGQMNMDAITAIMALHPIKALPEIVGARAANRLLTNEGVRNRVVEGIVGRR